jgi:D-sedoheptulose 7-phosphate isomerase
MEERLMIGEFLKRKLDNIQKMDDAELVNAVQKSAEIIYDSLKAKGKVLVCGNGGSAADSQHFAAELVGRFRHERKALPSIALHTNTSTMTAVANDYDYARVFSRQVEAFGQEGDVLFAISTSGKAKNVLEAVKVAKEKGITVIGLTGRNEGNPLVEVADVAIRVPGTYCTADIQEGHIMVIHMICEYVDDKIVAESKLKK